MGLRFAALGHPGSVTPAAACVLSACVMNE